MSSRVIPDVNRGDLMAADAVLDQIRHTIAMLFDIPVDQVAPTSSSETIEKWDSMGHLMLILELEQTYDRQFAPEEVEQMLDVASIVRILECER